MRDTWLWWSSGKDSAWALARLRAAGEFEVVRLITTVAAPCGRVVVHETSARLLELQARAVGLPLTTIALPAPCTNAEYAAAVAPVLTDAAATGVGCMAFGDLFLEDIRAYRTELLARHALEAVFPAWGRDTHALAREMFASGLEAVVTCVDTNALPADAAGTRYDREFVASLPEGVDPCGENGEFHTFATAGPMFAQRIETRVGAISVRDGFAYADLLPAEGRADHGGPHGGYTIERARAEQVAALADIEIAAAQLFAPEDLPGELGLETTPAAELERDRAAGRLWVALSPAGEPVGFAQACLVDGHPHLEELDVHPDHGRRGLGSRLLEAVVAWSRTQRPSDLTLTTFDHVPWNRPFYERHGFACFSPGRREPELRRILADEFAKGLRHRVAMLRRHHEN